MNNPVYDYAESDDNHMRVDFNCREYNNHRRTISDLSNVDDKTEVLYHSVGPSTCQDTGASSLRSETKAHIDEADMRAHCSIANSAAESEECHYEMESGKVS